MAIKNTNKLLPEFESVKDDGENILWTGKPKFIPYLITGLSLGVGSVLFIIVYYFFTKNEAGLVGNFSLLFAGIPTALFAWNFLSKILSFRNTSYCYSDKRVMMRTGFIGTNFKTIDYDKISDIEVTVNFVERMFNVGTIKFFSGRTEINDGCTIKLYSVGSNVS